MGIMETAENTKNKKIFIAGHKGMVGSAIHRDLLSKGFTNFVSRPKSELNLIRQADVEKFFEQEKPDYVIVASAKVGGIMANNTYRAQFIYENLMIESNIIQAAHQNGAEKLIFLGSSCIYPKLAAQPMKEEALLTGSLEATNEPYAIAKIAGIKLCESYYKQYGSNFFSVMPTNLYGPFDNYNLDTSHVMPALIRKYHEAKISGNKTVTNWGTGSPKREFLYVEDLADAVSFLLINTNAKDLYEAGITHINIGTGEDLTIGELASIVAKVIGYEGSTIYDPSKPDGTPRKLMDISRLHNLGWRHKTGLEEGISKAYDWFLKNVNN